MNDQDHSVSEEVECMLPPSVALRFWTPAMPERTPVRDPPTHIAVVRGAADSFLCLVNFHLLNVYRYNARV